ncbi:MAG: tetratricopeptide repeat protein, partial [Pseudomonadota bacterium]
NWTQVIQTHCTGAAKIASSPPPSVAGESVSQCVTYSCAGTVRPYFSNRCSPALPRVITVQVLLDPSFTRVPGWRQKLDTAFGHANWHFQPFGISFLVREIGEIPLITSKERIDDSVFENLVKWKGKSSSELHLGVISEKITTEHWFVQRLGESQFLSDLLFINSMNNDDFGAVLVHELGHTFGAFHRETLSSVMAPMTGENTWRQGFDKASAEVIRITKCADFRQGARSLPLAQIEQIGQIFESATTPEDVNPLVFVFDELATAAVDQKKEDEALVWAKRAVALQPRHPMGYLVLGWTQLDLGRNREGRETFERGLELSAVIPRSNSSSINLDGKVVPFRAIALTGLGDAWRHLEDPVKAKSFYLAAISENSDYAGGYTGLGWLALDSGDRQQAIQHFEKALSVNPNSKPAQRGLEKAKAKKPS